MGRDEESLNQTNLEPPPPPPIWILIFQYKENPKPYHPITTLSQLSGVSFIGNNQVIFRLFYDELL